MTRITTIALILVLLTLSLAGCDEGLPIDVYERVDVPVVLVFPDEGMQDDLENHFVDRVEDANELYKNSGVQFDIVGVRVVDYNPEFDANRDLGALLEMTPARGPLALYVVDTLTGFDGAGYGGYAQHHPDDSCHKATFFLDTVLSGDEGPLIVAHEVGHQFGLPHVEDPENFMHPDVQGSEITQAQEDHLLLSGNYYNQRCL